MAIFELPQLFLGIAFAVSAQVCLAETPVEVPVKTTVCQILADPRAWNHKLVEVTGFASHGFEDSGFSDPSCASRYGGLWMEFGGTKATGTMSTASDWSRDREKEAVVEGIRVPLIEDDNFKKFDDALHQGGANMVHVTVIARVFAGTENSRARKGVGGYGHMGCCSLFLVQQVISVDLQRPAYLDYTGDAEQPNAACYSFLTEIDNEHEQLESQHLAEIGPRTYAFDDPDRVAREAVAQWSRSKSTQEIELKRFKTSASRIVYKATVVGAKGYYLITLSRPYWISFYAANRDKVAWSVQAVIATCETGVGANGGTVTKLK